MATHTLRSPDLHASAQHPCRRAWGRQSRLSVHARLKIPQNHKKPVNPYVDIDADKLHTDANYLPAPTFGPVKLTNIPGNTEDKEHPAMLLSTRKQGALRQQHWHAPQPWLRAYHGHRGTLTRSRLAERPWAVWCSLSCVLQVKGGV